MDYKNRQPVDADDVLTFRLTAWDRQQLEALALRLRCTREEALRWLLGQTTAAPPQPIDQTAHQLPLLLG